MEWFLLTAPIPGSVSFNLAPVSAWLALLLSVAPPLYLLARSLFPTGSRASEAQLPLPLLGKCW